MDAAIWSGGSQRFELQLHISRPNHHELNCTVCSLSTDKNWAFCQTALSLHIRGQMVLCEAAQRTDPTATTAHYCLTS
ncbi:hypothetical protein NQZ68_000330 [Dissostichus eleginoides]|nr:hypothetical protein NQZ68_000330 [Dissostichus eleginoides]